MQTSRAADEEKSEGKDNALLRGENARRKPHSLLRHVKDYSVKLAVVALAASLYSVNAYARGGTSGKSRPADVTVSMHSSAANPTVPLEVLNIGRKAEKLRLRSSNARVGDDYDLMMGETFRSNTKSLSYYVTATTQKDRNGFGPLVLINGVTNDGYFYQFGYAYNQQVFTPNGGSPRILPGFSLVYQEWDPLNRIKRNYIMPLRNGKVKNEDILDLSMSIGKGSITISCTNSVTYDVLLPKTSFKAHGTTFIGSRNDIYLHSSGTMDGGGWTGLLFEWHSFNPKLQVPETVDFESMDPSKKPVWVWIVKTKYNTLGAGSVEMVKKELTDFNHMGKAQFGVNKEHGYVELFLPGHFTILNSIVGTAK
ncbi:MAG: hypothetical protein ACREBH_03750 [Candidatus Micrarchaeaceae archaeon]